MEKSMERIGLILVVAFLGQLFVFPILLGLLNSITGRQFKLSA